MQVKFDYFNRPEDPQLYICNVINTKLAPIVRYADSNGTNTLQITMNYNRTSELSIQVYKYIKNTFHRKSETDNSVAECYKYIANYRQIHVEGLGYFIITEATKCDDGFDPYWDIKATSCENEINNKCIIIPKGTYQFYDPNNLSGTILGRILNLCPNWSIGTISSNIASLYRTFDDVSQNAYNFMMNDMANAFGCICDFDIENRKINILDMNTEIPSTDILLTYDNVINNTKLDQPSENIVTALNVSGGSDAVDSTLDITNVNPISGNVIYNFSYFMNTTDMTQDLIDAINVWQGKVDNNQSAFSDLVLQIQNEQSTLETLYGELADLNVQLKSLNQDLSVCLADANRENYSTIKSNINSKQTEVKSKQTEINNQVTKVDNLNEQLYNLQSSLSIQNNFTPDQYKQLNRFIHQVDFKDENIITTKSMTYAQKQAQAQSLYDKAVMLLNQRCKPTTTIEVECQNFILMPEFNKFRDQIELGKMIHVELNDGNIINMMFLQYQINYDTKALTIKVSNRLKLHDIVKDVQDWQNQLSASANSLSLNKQVWNYAPKTGVITTIENFIASPINLSNNGIIAANNQKMLIDDTGYHGFQYDELTQTYSADQCWLTQYGLYFTTDSWNTVKCAFGKFAMPDGTEAYGFNGDTVVAGKIKASCLDLSGVVTKAELKATADGIELDVSNKASSLQSQITQNYNSISTTVEDTKNDLQTQITQTANSISDKVSAGDIGTLIQQHASDVIMAFNSANGSKYIKVTGRGFNFYNDYTGIGGMGIEYDSNDGVNYLQTWLNGASGIRWGSSTQYAMSWYPCDQSGGHEGGLHCGNLYPLYVDMKDTGNIMHVQTIQAENGTFNGLVAGGKGGETGSTVLQGVNGTQIGLHFQNGLFVGFY